MAEAAAALQAQITAAVTAALAAQAGAAAPVAHVAVKLPDFWVNPLPDGPLAPPLTDGPRSDWT
jgi:hypothetical protein